MAYDYDKSSRVSYVSEQKIDFLQFEKQSCGDF